jgi:arylsulfate sulfotransferase
MAFLVRRTVLLAALCGCGDNHAGPADAPPAPVDAPADAAPLAFTRGPIFTLAPNASTPLAGQLALATNRPTRVALTLRDPERTQVIDPARVGDGLAAEHTVPVLGFRPATTHTLAITVTDAAGESLAASDLEVTTAALPADFPVFTTHRIAPDQTEPGVTLTGLTHYVMAIDDTAHVVWFSDRGEGAEDVRRLANGHLLINLSNHIVSVEIDFLGNEIRRWHAASSTPGTPGSIPVAIDSFHHELGVLPDGDLYTLTSDLRSYVSYPTSELDPTPRSAPQQVVGDAVVQFHPDGTVVHRYALLDRLDPYRIAYGAFGVFWIALYGLGANVDWSHGNAAFPDPAGGFLVSLRHQDAVVKLDAAGALQWILGNHDNWSSAFAPYLLTPVGAPFQWQYHQHAPRILADGHVLLFDNGNFRVSPPAPKPATSYSRAVEYAVDGERKEVHQVWQYDADQLIFAPATGDVDIGRTTGNVIICFGGASRIVEVTHTDPPVKVFEMTADRTFYRAERLASLYRDGP